jgi:hypothetical protein
LAILSYAEQTYGPKGTIRIFKDLHLGSTRTFNLIDRLKCKIFSIPLDPALGEFTLVKEKTPLIQMYESKKEMIEALHEGSHKKLAVYSPSQRVTPDYLMTSGRRCLHENSLPLPDRPITSDEILRIDEQDDEREISARTPLKGGAISITN